MMCDVSVGEERSLIQCGLCRLYYHYRCIGLHPSISLPAFTCSQCKPAAGRRRSSSGENQDHVTTETGSTNCSNDDLLEDFFDSNNESPAVGVIGKTKYGDVEDDDGDDDCIMID